MSKLDDVLDGTHEDEVADLKAKVEEAEANPVEPATSETGGYAAAEEILTAEANGELTQEQTIALLDELEDADPAPESEPGDEDGESVVTDAPIAGPGDQVRLLKTGEIATVAHMAGDGAVSLRGEEKPKRTVARHEYTLA